MNSIQTEAEFQAELEYLKSHNKKDQVGESFKAMTDSEKLNLIKIRTSKKESIPIALQI